MRIGTETDNMEMVTTDDRGRIPAKYQEFVEVFNMETAETLPPHRLLDHPNDLEPDSKLPYWLSYNLSEFDLKTFKACIECNLGNAVSIEYHPQPYRRSYLERKKNEDYCCLSTI
jgi:hypothetical protein